jgi:hypothetical protein
MAPGSRYRPSPFISVTFPCGDAAGNAFDAAVLRSAHPLPVSFLRLRSECLLSGIFPYFVFRKRSYMQFKHSAAALLLLFVCYTTVAQTTFLPQGARENVLLERLEIKAGNRFGAELFQKQTPEPPADDRPAEPPGFCFNAFRRRCVQPEA